MFDFFADASSKLTLSLLAALLALNAFVLGARLVRRPSLADGLVKRLRGILRVFRIGDGEVGGGVGEHR